MDLNKKRKYIIENTTVLVYGHNIKPFALLTIESLLSVSKFKREQIVYFDDESTDGTREELENRGIKCITWKENENNDYLSNIYAREYIDVRLSLLLESAYKQIESEYLFVIDGDNIFLDDPTEFILDYMVPYNSADDVLFFGFSNTDFPNGEYNYKQFHCHEDDRITYILRNIMYFNKHALEKHNALNESLSDIYDACDDWNNIMSLSNYKTGAILNRKLIPFINQSIILNNWTSANNFLFLNDYVIHIGKVSSAMRKSSTSGVIKEDVVVNIKMACESIPKHLLKKLNITQDSLLEFFEKYYNKSDAF